MAETYNIYDFYSMPPFRVAIFVCGLRDDSRIKMRFSGNKVSTDRLLMAMAVDSLSYLVYSKTEDARNGIKQPKMISKILLGIEDKKELIGYSSAEEFEKAWNS